MAAALVMLLQILMLSCRCHADEIVLLCRVRYAGEVEVMAQQAPELVRTEERIVEVTQPGNPCACIRDGLNLDRLSQGPGGFSAGANGLMTSGHTYIGQVSPQQASQASVPT